MLTRRYLGSSGTLFLRPQCFTRGKAYVRRVHQSSWQTGVALAVGSLAELPCSELTVAPSGGNRKDSSIVEKEKKILVLRRLFPQSAESSHQEVTWRSHESFFGHRHGNSLTVGEYEIPYAGRSIGKEGRWEVRFNETQNESTLGCTGGSRAGGGPIEEIHQELEEHGGRYFRATYRTICWRHGKCEVYVTKVSSGWACLGQMMKYVCGAIQMELSARRGENGTEKGRHTGRVGWGASESPLLLVASS